MVQKNKASRARTFLKSLYYQPFETIDSLSLMIKGREFNIFVEDDENRKIALRLATICLAAWLVFGFDSTPLQFIHVLYELPGYFMGQLTLGNLISTYHNFYGKEMHYSAFVIYMLAYYSLSLHFAKCGITRTKNTCYSAALTWLSIGIFEFFWMYSFSIFQGQPWVSKWAWPQLRILMQNLLFVVVGASTVLYLWLDSFILKDRRILGRTYKLNFSRTTMIFMALTLAFCVFWLYYPGHVDHIFVTYESGEIWTNSRMFPQTLYTIDLQPHDHDNSGVWFYVPNNAVHAVNTLAKIFMTAAIISVFMVKQNEI